MDEYTVLAEVYDILNPKEDVLSQKAFFETLVKKYSVLKVLDCACGTGLHLSMFHDMGLTCFGSDLSKDMLERAKQNLAGKYIPLKVEDFRNLGNSWSETYDMVTCLTTSLPHMLTDDDIVAALTSMYDRLNTGGILVITNGISDSLLNRKPSFIPARVNKNDAFYFVCEYRDETTMTFHILYIKKTEESFDHLFTSITYNAMKKAVLERCFGQTKFTTVSYYGDYDMSAYDIESSPGLIVVAEK